MKHSHHHVYRSSLSTPFLLLGLAMVSPTLALATDLQTYGGSGGTPFRDECPKGWYLVGLDGRAGEWVDRIATVCAPWLRDKQTFGKPAVGRYHGDSTGGVKREPICWGLGINNRVVQSWELTRLTGDKKFVRYIIVNCTSLASPTATGRFTFGGPITADEGTTFFDEAGTQRPDAPLNTACPAGEVAIGIHGRAGLFLDQIGLICGHSPAKFIAPPATSANPLAVAPTIATKVNPLAVSPVSDDKFVIVKPTENYRVVQGQLVLLVKPPKLGVPPVTALEFRWLDAPPGQPPSYTVAVETPKLLQDYLVPQQSQPRNAGRWEVRARTAAQPTPGPWSQPVRFQIVLVQPFQSQRQPSSIQQTAPLPSSSVMQPSAIPQTAPLPSSSVTQAPAPSSATTQMKRSSSMIMPRGLDKQAAPDSNQTVDPLPKPEKKP